MYIKVELNGAYSLIEELWDGALDTLDELTNEEIRQVMDYLEEESSVSGEDLPTIDDVNDFFWHERDAIAVILGYKNFDEIMERNRENA